MKTFCTSILLKQINFWDRQHRVNLNGFSPKPMTEEHLLHYQRCGLLANPQQAVGEYGELHRLQLVTIRVLMDKGLPLDRIRVFLDGKSVAELRVFEEQAIAALRSVSTEAILSSRPAEEMWRIIPLTDDFLLVARSGRSIGTERRRLLAHILKGREVIVPRPQRLNRPRGGGATTLTS